MKYSLVFLLSFLVLMPVSIFAADPMLLNFENREKAVYTRFENSADAADIRRWSLNRGLTPHADRSPFADKRANYVSSYGSTVKIQSLNANTNYSLYIDFVSFERGSGGVISRLDIFCDGEKLYEMKFGDQPALYVRIPIPRSRSMDGTVVLSFEEFGTTKGVWGIWDMIVAEGALPEKIEYKPEIPPLKDSSAAGPDAKAGAKDKAVKKISPKEPSAKPVPKTQKEPKDVVDPKIQPVDDVKQPKSDGAEPPKIPLGPSVKEPDIRDQK